MYEETKYKPAGDRALVVEFGNEIQPRINRRVREIACLLQQEKIDGVIEWVPTYRSILIIYDPSVVLYQELVSRMKVLEKKRKEMALPPPVVTEIPTVYGGEYGPDLEYVAKHNNLQVEEVIRIHSEPEYLIYMLGFTPGFTYLGGMSPRIATPRLSTPRTSIPGGSVGIAAGQTGIYPMDSPGGWQLIGRTPLVLFDPKREEPVLLKAGNYLKFIPVCVEKYLEIKEKVEKGEYRVKVYTRNRNGEGE